MLSVLYIGYHCLTFSLYHCIKALFFPVNGETLPQHSDLYVGPAGVFCV